MDIYEGYPRLYEKEIINVESEIGIVTAMVYVMAEHDSNLISIPSVGYYNVIKDDIFRIKSA